MDATRSTAGLVLLALAMTALPLSAQPAREAEVQRWQATAYDLESGALLYRERHALWMRDDRPSRQRVEYFDRTGRLIAEKTLRYGRDGATPSFRFTDHRSGRLEAASRLARGRFRVQLRESAVDELEVAEIETDARAMVDEGFHAAARRGFPRLLAGDSLVLDTVVAARLSSYDMRLSGRGTIRRNGRELLRVRLDMASVLLRLVGPEAELFFDVEERRLVEFHGLSNLRDADGELQYVRVVYGAPRASRD